MSNRDSDVPIDQDSDDDFDWEEVEVPEHQHQQVEQLPYQEHEQQQPEEKHIEITIQASSSKKKKDAEANKNRGISHAERQMRITCHKLHTIILLLNAATRNRWINDELLHARLLSLTPMNLQNAFSLIHKSRFPDPNQRGRMFETAISNLAEWWAAEFFEVTLDGHLRNRTYEAVQSRLDAIRARHPDAKPDEPLDMKEVEKALGMEPEVIKSPKSLMKHALMQVGSRDTSAQLFTALCRALGIPSRLVVSLQSVPWQTNVGKPKPTYKKSQKGKGKAKGKAKAEENDDADEDQDMEEVDVPKPSVDIKGKGKAKEEFPGNGQRLDGSPLVKSAKALGKQKAEPEPVIKLRKQKDRGHVLGGPSPSSPSASSSRYASPLPSNRIDPTKTPPVFWTEVFSRPDGRWIPVDPIRSIVNKRKVFDPTPVSTTGGGSSNPSSLINTGLNFPSRSATPRINSPLPKGAVQDNRMLYVMAFEEDGYARDVTRRYAREYSAKVAKAQGGSKAPMYGGGGKGREAWWDSVVQSVARPYRLHRDDVEDEELDAAQYREPMPSTIAGFKDHPLYVLQRHLKQTEVIHPPPPDTPELGKFRGEPVYPRSSVVSLKTAENWMRSEGRTVKEGEQPLKMVKVRAGTINKLRELEVLKEAGADAEGSASAVKGEAMQGLYAWNQTEAYVPPPVTDGIVPKNNFGNVDLYVPSMLPRGGVHVPFKGVAKIAKKLGIDYAEAVTGFEFKKRRAFPVIEGVVVAKENETILVEAYLEAEEKAARKAQLKREERTIKLWTKFIQGLRIRQRLQEQYARKPSEKDAVPDDEAADAGEGSGGFVKETKPKENAILGMSRQNQGPSAFSRGGFLVAADDVVQPYHLPKAKFQPEFQEGTPRLSPALSPEDAEMEAVRQADEETDELVNGAGANGFDPMQIDLSAMDEEEDAEMEEISLPEPPILNGNGFVPKSMQELAEDAFRRKEEEGEEGDIVETFGEVEGAKGESNTPQTNGAAAKRSTRGSTRVANAPAPAIVITPAKAKTNGKAKGKRAAPATRRQSGRKTTKKRKLDEEEEEEGPALSSADDDHADGGQDEKQEEEQVKEEIVPSPSKRPRRSTRKNLNYKEVEEPAPATTSKRGRTLRPR